MDETDLIKTMELDEPFLKMSMKAYPYLKGFVEPGVNEWWCEGYHLGAKDFGHGTFRTDIHLFIDPPLTKNERFQVYTQDILQKIYKKILKVAYDGDVLLAFHDWVLQDVKRQNLTFNRMWLCFLMEKCFHKFWDGTDWEAME